MRTFKTIGFVGLGRMGFHMAGHLARAGFKVLPYDSNPDAVAKFAIEEGIPAAASLTELGRAADAVITMLPTSKIVREVVLGSKGSKGLAEHLPKGAAVIDMSTSDPSDTRQLGADLAPKGIFIVDAPVAGGVVFAKDGTLDILTGGDAAILAALEPVLRAMGRTITHCGPLGAAHALKAINNFVNAGVLAIYLEALVSGLKVGIDLETMMNSIEAATLGRNHPYEKKIKGHILNRRFAAGMAMRLIAKDVGIAVSLAEAAGLRAPLAKATLEVWNRASEEIGPERDQTEIVRFWERAAGLELRAPK